MEILFLFALLLSINLLQIIFSNPGSDHFIHFGYINSIKSNSNRFITKVKTFINDDDFPDPQLYHWLLAALPSSLLERKYKFFGLIFNLLSFGFFVAFTVLLYPYLNLGVDFNKFVLVVGLIYILTPFEYFAWNAKNVGLSARGFGLMFGHLFVYATTLYIYSNEFLYLAFSILFAYVILLSSQFAYQFVLFFCVTLVVATSNFIFLLIPIVSIVTFIISFPEWSKVFFTRQLGYKKMYYKILSARFGLKLRYSIWRDFVYDFWLNLKKKGLIHGLEYIYRNPVVEVMVGFPSLTSVCLIFAIDPSRPVPSSEKTLGVIIFCSLVIFILTSFRKTRFLGEPQRYVEFVFPLISILPLYSNGAWALATIITFSSGIVLFELFGIRFLARKEGSGSTNHEKTVEMLEAFRKIDMEPDEVRIASNNNDILKYFAEDKFKILNVKVTDEFTGGIHFNDIFPETYGHFSLDSLLKLVDKYKVNWLILDERLTSNEDLSKAKPGSFTFVKTVHHFTIFKCAKEPR